MALTKITTNVIADDAITPDKISNTVTLGGPKIANVQYADATFTVLDDTAANTSGTARLVINGEGFTSGAIVIVGSTQATSTTLVSANQLRANVTAQAAGSYPIYVQNADGATAIRVSGVTFSNTPIWGTAATLDNQAANTAFGVNISANSDSSVTYSNTTTLPAGTTLSSNGYFYGTVTIGAETTYSFDVKATDAENQDTPRTFSLTVTVAPVRKIYTWGYNNIGQLGLNDTINRSSPVQVGASTNWSVGPKDGYIAEDWMHFIKTDGTLWAWGRNTAGQLGLNNTIYRSSPTQVGSDTNWKKVSHSGNGGFALKTNGTIWTFGSNGSGSTGLNQTSVIVYSSPVQIGTDTNWADISADGNNSPGAIKTNGTLWTWGYNALGAVGDSTSTDRSSPVQIGSGTDWSKIYCGRYHKHAIKTNGTLWSWGYGSTGQLGLGTTLVTSPNQVGTGTTWLSVHPTYESSFAIKTDKTAWVWGRGIFGGNGINDESNYNSPVQLGTNTNWISFAGGRFHTIGVTE